MLLRGVLWSAQRLRLPLGALGVDFPVFLELLRVRILIDTRQASSQRTGLGAAGVALSLVMTAGAGLLFGALGLLTDGPGPWVLASQSMLLALLSLVLFGQLAGLLIDPTDIGVVAAHPVADRTLFAVRLAQVLAYVLAIVFSFTLGNLVPGAFKLPLGPLLTVYPFLALLCGLTTLGATSLLFATCLRLVGPGQFQRVSLWVQVVAGGLFFGGFQLMQVLRPSLTEGWLESDSTWLLLWPPFQYSRAFALACGEVTRFNLLAAGLALALPLASLALTFTLASRYFSAGLSGTLSQDTGDRVGWGGTWAQRLAARFSRDGEQRAGFSFALALSRREPHFLRGVLPQLIMFQIMAVAMILGRHHDVGMGIPMAGVMLMMCLPSVLIQLQGSATPEARWLFASLPLRDESELMRGGLKAALVFWLGLPALLVSTVLGLLVGPAALPRIVLAQELALIGALIFMRMFDLGVPFTRPVRVGAAGMANFGIIMGMGLSSIVFFGVHWLIALHPLSLAAGLFALALLIRHLWRRLDRLEVHEDWRLRPPRVRPDS